MSEFIQNFRHGFFHGMFDRTFLGWNISACYNAFPVFSVPNFMCFNPWQYQSCSIPMPSVYDIQMPSLVSNNANLTFNSINNSLFTPAGTANMQLQSSLLDDSYIDFSLGKTKFHGTEDVFIKDKSPRLKKTKVVSNRTDGDFDKMLSFVL